MSNFTESIQASLKKIKDAEKQRLELARQIQDEKNSIQKQIQNIWYNLQIGHDDFLDEVSVLLPDLDLEQIINAFTNAPKIIKHPNAKNVYHLANSTEGVFYRAEKKEFFTLEQFVNFFAQETGKKVKLSKNKDKLTIGDRVFKIILSRRINYYEYKVWFLLTFEELK